MVIGSRAGAGPRRMAWQWRARQLLGGLLVVAGAFFAVAGTGEPWIWLVFIASGLGVWSYAGSRVRRAQAGTQGEREVARTLGRWAVVSYGWCPPGRRSDVDVVVTWPAVAAIEVKRGSGRVRTHRDGSVEVDGRRLPGEPLRQATRNAAAVRRHLDLEEHVDAVLCVTDMAQRPRWVEVDGNPVVVCSARHLRRVLRRLPRVDRVLSLELLGDLEIMD